MGVLFVAYRSLRCNPSGGSSWLVWIGLIDCLDCLLKDSGGLEVVVLSLADGGTRLTFPGDRTDYFIGPVAGNITEYCGTYGTATVWLVR